MEPAIPNLILSAVVSLLGILPLRAETARNPIVHADVPDIAMIRVGDTYYMSSTTMHMSPGLPIMKSTDLVNWRMASYAYETLADNEALRLENGKNAYGAGSFGDRRLASILQEIAAVLLSQLQGVQLRLVKILAMQDDFSSEPLHRLQLQRIGIGRRHHLHCEPGARAAIGDALPEISGGRTDHRPVLLGKALREPGCPAPLERADRIERFDLQQDRPAKRIAQPVAQELRCCLEYGIDRSGGRRDPFDREVHDQMTGQLSMRRVAPT